MIGYYVHHHGSGHLARAELIAWALDQPVTVLSSLPAPHAAGPFADWIELPRDDDLVEPADPCAGGALHWAPLSSPGLRRRMAVLSQWIADTAPAAMVVDVSVEVAVASRLQGVRTVVVAQPGLRSDDPHRLVYRMATAIIAPWPSSVLRPAHLAGTSVEYVGAFSRFDHLGPLPVRSARSTRSARREVLVLLGSGGDLVGPAELDGLAAACPDHTVRALGGSFGWEPDPWQALLDAEVVVTHAGLNVLAETAAARRPAVVIAHPRPFDEQACTASALNTAGIALGLPHWPDADRWPALLDEALGRGGDGWGAWNDGCGAGRAARVIDTVAADA